jgi:hypothetical protein
MNQVVEETQTEYCVNHPKIATSLHCNRCGNPICPQCAVLTPTGYRCKDCVRSQQKTFDTTNWIDYPLSFFIAGFLGFIGSLLITAIGSRLGFFAIIIAVLVAPIVGSVIAGGVRMVIQKRRSKRLFQVATLGAALGALPLILTALFGLMVAGGGLGSLYPLIWQGIYLFMVPSTVYYRLSGIQMKL